MNTGVVDIWSIVHHLYGSYFYSVFGCSFYSILVIALLWELFENSQYGLLFWNRLGENDYSGDSAVNSMSDIFFTYSGWQITTYIYKYYSFKKNINSGWKFTPLPKSFTKFDTVRSSYIDTLLGINPSMVEKEVFFGQQSRHYGKIR